MHMKQCINGNNQTDISSLKGIEAIAPEMSVKRVAVFINYMYILEALMRRQCGTLRSHERELERTPSQRRGLRYLLGHPKERAGTGIYMHV